MARPDRPIFSFPTLRIREIERVVGFKYGSLARGEDLKRVLLLIAQHYQQLLIDKYGATTRADVLERVEMWASRRTPEATARDIADAVTSAYRLKKLPKADSIAKQLLLSYHERTLLRITTIGACDVGKRDRKKLSRQRRQQRDRIRALAKRRAKGSVPREAYLLANSTTARCPWKLESISRATFYRRRKAARRGQLQDGETSPSTILKASFRRKECVVTDLSHAATG